MVSRPSQSDEHFSISSLYSAGDSCAPVEFYAGDPVYVPVAKPRRRARRAVLTTLLLAGGAFGWVQAPDGVKVELRQAFDMVKDQAADAWARRTPVAVSESPVTPETVTPETVATTPPPPMPEARSIDTAPHYTAGIAVAPPASTAAPGPVAAPELAAETEAAAGTEPGSQAVSTSAAEETPPPLPPPSADPKDPLQKRALAAGLHPDVSRAVLSKLTEADYRNAARAIKTALADTPPGETYAWPQNGGDKTALFEVKFVKGSDASCRRYVVTVTKTRWSTTAPPMETCGGKTRWSTGRKQGAAAPDHAQQGDG